jgi:hypothetical protein
MCGRWPPNRQRTHQGTSSTSAGNGRSRPGAQARACKQPAFLILSYANLESVIPIPVGSGNVARFIGSVVRDVRLEGRNLLPVVAYLQQHRIPCGRELPTYFRALGIATRLIAFARARPDAAEHDLVAYFVYTLLAALAVEEEQAANPQAEPGVS